MGKHIAIAIAMVGGLLLSGISLAQNPAPLSGGQNANPPTASAQPGPPRIAPGNVIPVQLTKTGDAKKAKPGDQVMAKVTQDLKSDSGVVIVPKGTEVIGHVTEAQARNKEQKESQLGIAFDQAKMKSGDLQVPMSIQAVIAPPSMDSGDGGNGAPQAAEGAGPSASPSAMGGHMGSAGSAAPPQQAQPLSTPTGPAGGAGAQPSANGRPTITGKTQGVIGIPNLKLEGEAQNSDHSAQGSVMSSEKNNVKLEGGTLMLLRVSPANLSPASQNPPNQQE